MSNAAFDAATFSSAGNPPTFNHTCGGSDRYLLVGITDWAVDPLNGTGTTCTYIKGGIATNLTDLGSYITTPSGLRLFGMVNPDSGTNQVVVGGGGGAAIIAIAMSFTNVHQTVSIGTLQQANGVSTTASVNVTGTNIESMIACLVSYFGPNTGEAAGAGQSNHTNGSAGNSGIAMSTEPGNGGTVTMSETWNTGTDNWAIGAIELFTATPATAVKHELATTGVGS